MNDFLGSIRADLTDRRLLPVVALVAACLVAAIAYAVLGGGSSIPTPAATGNVPSVTPTGGGISVTSTTPEHAVAETTDGFKEQKSGSARNPFAPLISAKTVASGSSATTGAATEPSSSSGSGATTGSSGSSGAASEPSAPAEEKSSTGSEPTKHGAKHKTVYDVTIQFGTLPPGVTPETAKLTQFDKLKLAAVLPTAQLPVIVFRGVTAKGATATFTIAGEAIPSGTGSCLPEPTQCEAVGVKPGATEQFLYQNADGTITVFELRVLSIKAEQVTAKNAKAAGWAESKAGRKLLRASGLLKLPFLRDSSQPGVLVFTPHRASAAKAHTAVITLTG